MNEKSWNKFEKTGKISDYLNYKLSNGDVINSITPEESSDLKKLNSYVNGGIGYANQDERHRP